MVVCDTNRQLWRFKMEIKAVIVTNYARQLEQDWYNNNSMSLSANSYQTVVLITSLQLCTLCKPTINFKQFFFRKSEAIIGETDVLVGWRRGRDGCCCPFPGCCKQSPSPSSQHQTQHCRWCSLLTQSLRWRRGGKPPTCRLSHTVSGNTLCSHSWNPLSTPTTTAMQFTIHWYHAEVSGWFSLVGVSASSNFQCFDTVDWLTARASSL